MSSLYEGTIGELKYIGGDDFEVAMKKTQSLIGVFEEDFDEPNFEEHTTTLRISSIDDETTPQDIRGLLEKFGKVGDVIICSGRNGTYALAYMDPFDARKAAGHEWNGKVQRDSKIIVIFINRADELAWLASHDRKTSKGKRV